MNKAAAQRYAKTKVFTATPEQLQLMLYDGGLRFAEMARAALLEKNYEQSFKNISRVQRIVMELTSTLRHDIAPEICKNLAAIYAFVYRRLTEANCQRKTEPLDEAIRLLKYQRQTWALLMDKTGKQKAAQAASQIPDLPPPDQHMEATISLQG
jgi:flagellar protein FliS